MAFKVGDKAKVVDKESYLYNKTVELIEVNDEAYVFNCENPKFKLVVHESAMQRTIEWESSPDKAKINESKDGTLYGCPECEKICNAAEKNIQMDEKPTKDLSWHEKLNYIWCIIRFSKRIANWLVMSCEHCNHHELERIGKPIESDVGNQKEFQQKYRCLHCGAIGIVTQIWVKERGKKDDYIKSLKEKNEELTKALEFAMTLIPEDKLPSGMSYQSYRWLINKARKNEYIEPHFIGDEK